MFRGAFVAVSLWLLAGCMRPPQACCIERSDGGCMTAADLPIPSWRATRFVDLDSVDCPQKVCVSDGADAGTLMGLCSAACRNQSGCLAGETCEPFVSGDDGGVSVCVRAAAAQK